MPPKISFNREDIVESALNVIRQKGVKGLTAREVAVAMNGSTQPIYREFGTIEELETSAMDAAEALALKYMLEAKDEESNFLSVGMGYLEFARKEPALFNFLYMSGKKKFDFTSPGLPYEQVIEKMKNDPFLKDLDGDVLKKLLLDMHIYTHGLCTLSVVQGNTGEEIDYRGLLHDHGETLVVMETLKARGVINPEEIKKRCRDENSNS